MRSNLCRAAVMVSILGAAAVAGAQTVDEIVAKNLQAKGGAAKLKAVNSMKMSGKMRLQGTDVAVTLFTKRPNYQRQEVMLPGKTVVQAFDGTTAWMITPESDVPQEAPKAMTDMVRNRAEFDNPLIDYKQRGTTIDLVGKEKLGENAVYHLKLTTKSGEVQHYFLDADTALERKTSFEVDMTGSGQKQSFDTELSNYQQVDGIMLPHSMTQLVNGRTVLEITIEKVEFNPTIADELFRMPKK